MSRAESPTSPDPAGRPHAEQLPAEHVHVDEGATRATPGRRVVAGPALLRLLVVPLLVAAALVAGLAWAHASPIGADPDGDFHLGSIWCPPPVESSGCRLGQVGGKPAVFVPEVLAGRPCYVGKGGEPASCVDRLSRTELVPSTRFDRGEYPGPYYHVMHRFVTPDVDAANLQMRQFNVVLAVAAWTLALLLLPRRSRPAVALALVVGVVPLGMFLIASVNPSAWAFTGLTTYWMALQAQATATSWWRRVPAGILAAAGATMAAVARGDSFPFILIVSTVIAVLHLRRPLRWDLAAPVAVAVAVGAWSFGRAGQAGSLGATSTSSDDPGLVFVRLLVEIWQVPAGVFGVPPWGALGWLELPLPTGVYVPLLLVAGFALVTGLARPGVRRRLALVMVCGALLVLPFHLLWRNLDVAGIQPRYFMSLVPFALFLGMLSRDATDSTPLSRTQALAVWAAATYAHAVALYTVLARHTLGLRLVPLPAGEQPWWWAQGPTPTQWWGWAVAAFAVLAASLVVLHRRPPRAPEDDGQGRSRAPRGPGR